MEHHDPDRVAVIDLGSNTARLIVLSANGAEFVDLVQREIGLELRILDGEREAYYGALGALNEVVIGDGLILDIGGGSAQLSEVADSDYRRGQSLTLGALALTERFVRNDPPKKSELAAVHDEIETQLDSIKWLSSVASKKLVGIGGTIRNLAKIEAERQGYPLNTLHGFRLTRRSVEESALTFRELSLADRQKIPGLSSDRGDIILQGALVLLAVLERLELDEITISISGLREGIFFEHFLSHLPRPLTPDVRRFSVLNMARNYRYQKPHANHVRYLAGRLFEQLAPLHGYGPPEKELLDAAALLHDIGTIIAYDGHHQHTQTLIHYKWAARVHPQGDRPRRPPRPLPPQRPPWNRRLRGGSQEQRRHHPAPPRRHPPPRRIPRAWTQRRR